MVDAGWGRRAVEFSTLWEPAQWREVLPMRRRVARREGDRPLDVAEGFAICLTVELPDPETYARALASSGPAYEAIQSIGEAEFNARAVELASAYVRDGLPLRGLIQLFGYIGTKC